MGIYIRNSKPDEYENHIAGILFIMYRHIESPSQVTRNIIFIDSMAVDEKYRGKGIGHAFFDFLIELKKQKGYDGIELQVNAKKDTADRRSAPSLFIQNGIDIIIYKICGEL